MDGETADAFDQWLEALPRAGDLPFWPPPAALYTVERLYAGFSPSDPCSLERTYDARVYAWTLGADGRPRRLGLRETVAARLHDAAMDHLVGAFAAERPMVGVMGGHDVSRRDPAFLNAALLARALRRRGYGVVTGGGPGLMEAANLGAFLAPQPDEALGAAIAALGAVPDLLPGAPGEEARRRKHAWVAAAAEVRARLLGRWDADPPPGGESLGIPTWYYGDEPPNLFASRSGKYFMNSVREDGLVSIATAGLVFGKGAAGTVQEVFQNANYNFYRGHAVDATPMVFMDRTFWSSAAAGRGGTRLPVLPLVESLARGARPPFADRVLASDAPPEIVAFIEAANGARRGRRPADLRLASIGSLPPPRCGPDSSS